MTSKVYIRTKPHIGDRPMHAGRLLDLDAYWGRRSKVKSYRDGA